MALLLMVWWCKEPEPCFILKTSFSIKLFWFIYLFGKFWWWSLWSFYFWHDDVIKWRHLFSALLAFFVGNSLVTGGEFPLQRSVTWSFDVFFDLRLNKRLSKQSRRRWFETPLGSLWRHCNDPSEYVGIVPILLLWQLLYLYHYMLYSAINKSLLISFEISP